MGIWVRSYFVSDSLYYWFNQQDTTQYPIVSNVLGRSIGARVVSVSGWWSGCELSTHHNAPPRPPPPLPPSLPPHPPHPPPPPAPPHITPPPPRPPPPPPPPPRNHPKKRKSTPPTSSPRC